MSNPTPQAIRRSRAARLARSGLDDARRLGFSASPTPLLDRVADGSADAQLVAWFDQCPRGLPWDQAEGFLRSRVEQTSKRKPTYRSPWEATVLRDANEHLRSGTAEAHRALDKPTTTERTRRIAEGIAELIERELHR